MCTTQLIFMTKRSLRETLHTSLTPDKGVNILIHNAFRCHTKLYKLVNKGLVFGSIV